MTTDHARGFDAERSAKLFATTLERRHRDLDKAVAVLAASRADFMQRLEKTIAGTAEALEAKTMLESRIRRMLEHVEALRDGKLDRKVVALAHAEDLAVLNDPALQDVFAQAIGEAGGVPRPPADAMRLMTGLKDPVAWLERSGPIGSLGFLAPWIADAEDTASVRQGLGGQEPMVPPPLGVCSPAPYADRLTEVSEQAISNGFATVNEAGGQVTTYANAGVGALVPGFGSSRGVVLADFTLPAGYTSVTVTADLAVDIEVSAWAALAATWSVADLILTAEHSDGSSAAKVDWVATQVAPGIWGGRQKIVGSRRVILTRAVPAGGGRLRVGAGAHAYANAPVGLMGMSESFIVSTVRSVCIAAT